MKMHCVACNEKSCAGVSLRSSAVSLFFKDTLCGVSFFAFFRFISFFYYCFYYSVFYFFGKSKYMGPTDFISDGMCA